MTSPSVPSKPASHTTRHLIISLAALLGLSWASFGVVAYRTPALASADPSASPSPAKPTAPATSPTTSTITSPDVRESKTGPWGRMQLVPIVLELPEELATTERTMAIHDAWRFSGMDRATAMMFMASCGFTSEQIGLAQTCEWQQDGSSSLFLPSDTLILSLSPETRCTLYTRLMTDPANKAVIDPSFFRVGRVDFRLRGSDLGESSIALLKTLLYTGPDESLLFTDIKPALRAINDPQERTRFLKAVSRKRALMARLTVDGTTDTVALADYWGRGGRDKNLLPLLDSLKFNAVSGVETPGRINIAMLLPRFVQERLYQHAETTQPAGRTPDDCYWTAFNFYCDVPDDRVHDMTYLAQVLQRDYQKIETPSELGDVVLLADPRGNAFHAANFIADEVVFTKNGLSGTQPWILQPMKDMVTTYRITNPDLTVQYYRKVTK